MPEPKPETPASQEDPTQQPNPAVPTDDAVDDDDGGTQWPEPVIKPGP